MKTLLKTLTFNNVTGSVSLTVDRYVVTCTVSGGAWTYTSGVKFCRIAINTYNIRGY